MNTKNLIQSDNSLVCLFILIRNSDLLQNENSMAAMLFEPNIYQICHSQTLTKTNKF